MAAASEKKDSTDKDIVKSGSGRRAKPLDIGDCRLGARDGIPALLPDEVPIAVYQTCARDYRGETTGYAVTNYGRQAWCLLDTRGRDLDISSGKFKIAEHRRHEADWDVLWIQTRSGAPVLLDAWMHAAVVSLTKVCPVGDALELTIDKMFEVYRHYHPKAQYEGSAVQAP